MGARLARRWRLRQRRHHRGPQRRDDHRAGPSRRWRGGIGPDLPATWWRANLTEWDWRRRHLDHRPGVRCGSQGPWTKLDGLLVPSCWPPMRHGPGPLRLVAVNGQWGPGATAAPGAWVEHPGPARYGHMAAEVPSGADPRCIPCGSVIRLDITEQQISRWLDAAKATGDSARPSPVRPEDSATTGCACPETGSRRTDHRVVRRGQPCGPQSVRPARDHHGTQANQLGAGLFAAAPGCGRPQRECHSRASHHHRRVHRHGRRCAHRADRSADQPPNRGSLPRKSASGDEGDASVIDLLNTLVAGQAGQDRRLAAMEHRQNSTEADVSTLQGQMRTHRPGGWRGGPARRPHQEPRPIRRDDQVAPAAQSILDQATRLRPQRSKASDGTVGDKAHRLRVSDHSPDGRGIVHAADLTHDPARGMDAHGWARWLAARNDPRVKYIISNRRIWGFRVGWYGYGGENPHTKHVHVSIKTGTRFENDTAPWFDGFLSPPGYVAPTTRHRLRRSPDRCRPPQPTSPSPGGRRREGSPRAVRDGGGGRVARLREPRRRARHNAARRRANAWLRIQGARWGEPGDARRHADASPAVMFGDWAGSSHTSTRPPTEEVNS